MTQLAENTTSQALLKHPRPRQSQKFIADLQEQALQRFAQLGLPNPRQERWRFSGIGPVVRTAYEPAPLHAELDDAQRSAVAKVLEEHRFGAQAGPELVFVNGVYVPELSAPGQLRGVFAGSLEQARATHAQVVQKHLAQVVAPDASGFSALNTASFADVAFIHVPHEAVVGKPIHLLFIATPGRQASICHPRVLMVVEDGAKVSLVKTFAGTPGATVLSNVVTEIHAGSGCMIDHCRLQHEPLHAYHVSMLQARLGAGTTLVSQSASIGGAITANDLNVLLDGEQASATLNGLVVIGSTQVVDNHTLLDHAMPNCPSHELYKHVLSDHAVGVFKGQILVRKDAQKTDSKQTSRTLLLSDDATMYSQPALEIYADDVKCTHGSTTGPVDEDQRFYLQTRGLSQEAAQHLLTYAFAADITRRIAIPGVRQRLEDYMARQHDLPTDLRITDLGRHDDEHR